MHHDPKYRQPATEGTPFMRQALLCTSATVEGLARGRACGPPARLGNRPTRQRVSAKDPLVTQDAGSSGRRGLPSDPSAEVGSGLISTEDYSRSILRSPCVGVHHSTTSFVASTLRWVCTTSVMSA